jgi:hypothetical protein
MPNLLIPAAFAQQLHDYLLGRPMGEVEQLVGGLRQLRPAPQPDVTDPPSEFHTSRRFHSGETLQEH